MQLADFLSDVVAWAKDRSDISGLAIVGSHARGAATHDSDLDLILLCSDPATFIEESNWVERFGRVQRALLEHYGQVRVIRVFYAGGLEVEFGFSPVEWASEPLDSGTKRVILDGIRILHDPDGHLRDAVNATAT